MNENKLINNTRETCKKGRERHAFGTAYECKRLDIYGQPISYCNMWESK